MLNKVLQGAVLLEAAALVHGFPALAVDFDASMLEERDTPQILPFPKWPGRPAHALFNKFDAKDQHISVSGEHRFIMPGPNDIRGPCAGLNALANHGYISRSGIVSQDDIINGLAESVHLGRDLTTVLETATRFFDGNPLTGKWTIGYESDKVNLNLPLNLGNTLFNTPTGICDYGHLKTEGDASITRGDFLAPTMNSNCASYPQFVQELFDEANKDNKNGWITPQVLARHQYLRKQHSIATNPNYFSPAYAGVVFTFGAHMFAFQLLSNHSAEHPKGFLTQDNFLSLWGYKKGKNGELIYTYGSERFPENYYVRSSADRWNTEDVVLSTAQQCAAYPDNCQVGGNTGKVNSFSGVNVGDVSGGLANSVKDLSDPARMGCFISQAIQADVPSFLDKQFGANSAAVKALQKLIPTQLVPALASLGTCPNLPKGKALSQYGAKYPGAKTPQSGPRSKSQ